MVRCALLASCGACVFTTTRALVRIQSQHPPEDDKTPSSKSSDDATGVGDSYENTRWHADILKQWETNGSLPKFWDSVSGTGSGWEAAKPFGMWLPKWLESHQITTMVEASAGHWPSGWQRNVSWPSSISYTGVDVQPEVVEADRRLAAEVKFGLKSMDFKVWDMLKTPLPEADVLLVRDTLIHFPTPAIWKLLNTSVFVCPPRFKYVLFDNPASGHRSKHINGELNRMSICPNEDHHWMARCQPANVSRGQIYSGFRYVDMAMEPFSLPVEEAFQYQPGNHKVQLLRAPSCTSLS